MYAPLTSTMMVNRHATKIRNIWTNHLNSEQITSSHKMRIIVRQPKAHDKAKRLC